MARKGERVTRIGTGGRNRGICFDENLSFPLFPFGNANHISLEDPILNGSGSSGEQIASMKDLRARLPTLPRVLAYSIATD